MKSAKYFFIVLLILICSRVYPFPAEVTPLNDGNYFKTVHSMLAKAKKSIYVIMYSATYYEKYPDSLSNRLINNLISAKKRGLEVKAILDQAEDNKTSGSAENKKVADMLSRAGVNTYLDEKEITTHSKLVIIDGRYVIIGSANWSYYALSKNNETNVLINSEQVAKEYIKYFEEIAALCK